MKNENIYYVDDDKVGGVEFITPAYNLFRIFKKITKIWLPHGLLMKLVSEGDYVYRFQILEGIHKGKKCKINIEDWRNQRFPPLEYDNEIKNKTYDLLYSMAHNLRNENSIRSYPFRTAIHPVGKYLIHSKESAQMDLNCEKRIFILHNFNNYSHPNGLEIRVNTTIQGKIDYGKYNVCLPSEKLYEKPLNEGFMEMRNIHFIVDSNPKLVITCEQEMENSIAFPSLQWRDVCKYLLFHRKGDNILGEIMI